MSFLKKTQKNYSSAFNFIDPPIYGHLNGMCHSASWALDVWKTRRIMIEPQLA